MPDMILLPRELVTGILNYLKSRPYAEVAAGVQALEAAMTTSAATPSPEV